MGKRLITQILNFSLVFLTTRYLRIQQKNHFHLKPTNTPSHHSPHPPPTKKPAMSLREHLTDCATMNDRSFSCHFFL